MQIRTNALIPELSVANLAQSLAFYVGVVGFSIVYERKKDWFALIAIGNAQLMLDEIDRGRTWRTAPFEPPLGRGVNLQVMVDRLDVLIDSLRRAQVALYLEVEERWYRRGQIEVGHRQLAVQDPDGYLLRFVENLGERVVV